MYRIEELDVATLLEKIAEPVFPGPASGSAIAVGAAMGAALLEMSWRATLKKKPDLEQGQERIRIFEEGRKRLLALSTEDMEGYNVYVKAVSLKNTDPVAYDAALKLGTQPLVDIAAVSTQLLKWLDRIQMECYIKVQGDLAGSATLLHGAVQAASIATQINLRLMKSPEYPIQIGQELEALQQQAVAYYERIIKRVEGMLKE
jgi:formiminotetrahydrofolate cyclodeaminase